MDEDANRVPFRRIDLQTTLASLAGKGVFVGTSSWKYPGWRGMLYDEQRYVYRGKFAESRFEKNCLTEYAEVFKTVCVDAGYYRFPDHRYIEGLASQVPADFRFTFKVTDDITIKKFTNLPRFGLKAGKPNENFLNADLFTAAFVRPFEPFKANVGMFIFEFSKFYPSDYQHGRDFLADLDRFLGGIPKGWNYGVEIRNRHFLQPEYFALLARHGVAHVFNSWADMPPVNEQLSLPGSLTNPNCAGARFLLKPGRKYQEAVDRFSPYDQIKETYPEARTAAAELIREALLKQAIRKLFLYVNNRLEGNALLTIMALLEDVG
ncbi:MAG: hypothetical protein JWQ04_2102 [Pedosphaera sp.]|nr:hypothetical protein [Pedosphaera sp.]